MGKIFNIHRIRACFMVALSILVLAPAPIYAISPSEYGEQRIHWYDPAACNPSSATNAISGSVNNGSNEDNLKHVYSYMLGRGLTDIQAAGVVGNIAHESGGNPGKVQASYSSKIGGVSNTTDTEVVRAMGTDVGVGKAWGLIQWDAGGRAIAYAERAGITGPIGDMSTQLDLVWWHMNVETPTAKKNFMQEYTKVNELRAAVESYERGMEGAGDRAIPARVKAAQLALDTYPKTPMAGLSQTVGGQVPSAASTSCVCVENPTTSTGTVDVVIDPGHVGKNTRGPDTIDAATQVYIGETYNPGETEEVWAVAEGIKNILESKGYTVALTKDSFDAQTDHRKRAEIANNANAQVAVSLHTDQGINWVTPQEVGLYRVNKKGEQVKFTDAAVAQKSKEYADIMVSERQKVGNSGVKINRLSFSSEDRGPYFSEGNISNVQLFSKVPWVYHEMSRSNYSRDKYINGVANGVMAAVKPRSTSVVPPENGVSIEQVSNSTNDTTQPDVSQPPTDDTTEAVVTTPAPAMPTTSTPGACGAASGDVVQTALNFAWPDRRPAPYTKKKAQYDTATQAAIAAGRYVGGLNHPGVDCGGFVTRVMQDSGADPDYNIKKEATGGQLRQLTERKDMYTEIHPQSTADMQPGDIAVRSGHTYMYVGSGLTGSNEDGSPAPFTSDIASASVSFFGTGWRAPMAGGEKPADPKYRWFRLKGVSASTTTTPAAVEESQTKGAESP